MPYDAVSAFVSSELRQQSGATALALELLIPTAMRTNEVLGAQWTEFDLDARIWTAPADRMKSKKEHRVPLSKSAMAMLNALPQTEGCDYLFEGRRSGRPLSNMALLMSLRRVGHGDMTAHGFRSSLRDWAAECTSFSNEVAEMALAHVIEDKTESAYRRGDLFDKRRKLMQAWSDYLHKNKREA
jgi:integrase